MWVPTQFTQLTSCHPELRQLAEVKDLCWILRPNRAQNDIRCAKYLLVNNCRLSILIVADFYQRKKGRSPIIIFLILISDFFSLLCTYMVFFFLKFLSILYQYPDIFGIYSVLLVLFLTSF